jgi:hypothetical protein
MRVTVDHGEIIHFAGAHHLFPVARRDDATQVRLAAKGEATADEEPVGWKVYFRPFIDRGLVFLIEDSTGRAVTRAEGEAALTAAG